MSTQIIELAIRSPKSNVKESDFVAAKNDAVKKLVSIKGVGPEREFEPFMTRPAKNQNVYVGMTRYESQGTIYRSMMSLGFMARLMKFMKMMDPIAGVFLKPDKADFDYGQFAQKNNITEIALLRPKKGISVDSFLKARKNFLALFDAEPEIEKSYTFTVTGGFKAKDTFPHITVYKDKTSFDTIMERTKSLNYLKDFMSTFDAEIICFCTTKK